MKKTLFFPAKNKHLASLISLKSPEDAEESVRVLRQEFHQSKTYAKRREIQRDVVLAANRAQASQQRKNLSKKEHQEFVEIEGIYRRFAKELHDQLEL